LALVQTAIGAIVVLATSTLGRIMIVELSLPATLPAALIALHYVVQLQRVHHGHRVDRSGRCTPRIVGGMSILALGAIAAGIAVARMQTVPSQGIALAVGAYLLIGIGVGAAGTANLTLITKGLLPQRRPLAAALVWIMMIAGFSCSAGVAAHFLQPFSTLRLIEVCSAASLSALLLACIAVRGVESRSLSRPSEARARPAAVASGGRDFIADCARLWADRRARTFTLFLLTAMFAFSAQELLLEPLAGSVFGLPPAGSARLAGLQNAGVVAGMVCVVAAALLTPRRGARFAQRWMVAGTAGSALAVAVLAVVTALDGARALSGAALLLGYCNGLFAVAALGVMMELGSAAGHGREGIYMGLWGAAQAIAFAAGGIGAGTVIDLARRAFGAPAVAYCLLLSIDAALFLLACSWALRLRQAAALPMASAVRAASEDAPHEGALARAQSS
jgi:BCD family chlorophyll transporter-like MFS transporter